MGFTQLKTVGTKRQLPEQAGAKRLQAKSIARPNGAKRRGGISGRGPGAQPPADPEEFCTSNGFWMHISFMFSSGEHIKFDHE